VRAAARCALLWLILFVIPDHATAATSKSYDIIHDEKLVTNKRLAMDFEDVVVLYKSEYCPIEFALSNILYRFNAHFIDGDLVRALLAGPNSWITNRGKNLFVAILEYGTQFIVGNDEVLGCTFCCRANFNVESWGYAKIFEIELKTIPGSRNNLRNVRRNAAVRAYEINNMFVPLQANISPQLPFLGIFCNTNLNFSSIRLPTGLIGCSLSLTQVEASNNDSRNGASNGESGENYGPKPIAPLFFVMIAFLGTPTLLFGALRMNRWLIPGFLCFVLGVGVSVANWALVDWWPL
jgi:hypothetical protein